jgi:aminomethyltransferase
MNLKKPLLIDEHERLGAKLAPFGGWLMPISYAGIINEHNWTRSSASIFDISHMGEFIISGPGADKALNRVVTMNLSNLPKGSCRYGVMLNENGGIVDDLIVYKIDKDRWMIVVNASTAEKDYSHLRAHLPKEVGLEDVSKALGKIDIQGPLSKNILQEIVGDNLEKLKFYTFSFFNILDEDNIISRTGYTGELGYEIYISTNKIKELWNRLLEDKALRPAGLGARDTLRLEMAYPLYGQDITEDTLPQEAGLGQFVDLNKEFIGREALVEKKERGLRKKLACFKTATRRSPRHNHKIYHNDQQIGVVTSGSFAPSLGVGIGMGYVKKSFDKKGTKVKIGANLRMIEAEIVKKPFYREGSARN